ncbi:MAG: SGNH/GDSL hydrolase family protein [Jannaschia helgolandensis]|jgi:lysophospholipase L1-like esterase|uniref:Lysophospholipase L1 n=1 Tax=Jannaschia helgolandensis TaxID=188906 RepID=A0A1H7IT53_9RHOB|nr:SGNH/GDSL hydrolase family protein [Jannaschia helgolandensis]SEK65578.1 Lysophospholipase L1 [Jannaschia helgolandensis]
MRLFAFLPLILSACVATSAPPSDNAVLAIGDSVMAWNGGQGIPEAVQATLGRPVVDKAQSLAQLTNPNGIAGALGFDISRQYKGGDWDWVILTGGGNDLRGACRTPDEAGILNDLIGPGLTGDIPTLIARIRANGSMVAFIGYYDGARGAATGFTPCQGAFDIINARMTQLAAQDAGMLFFDAGSVIDAGDRGLYAPDLIHPSPRGSAIIGQALAQRMAAFE